MNRYTAYVSLVLALGGLTGCAGMHKHHGSASSEIHAVSKQQGDLISRRDAAGIAALYTANAEVSPPNAPVVKGTRAIQEYWQSSFATDPVTVSVNSTEVESSGDMAWEVGNYAVVAADGKTLDKGKYVTVWKRENGQWKLHRDIFNSDLPATSQ